MKRVFQFVAVLVLAFGASVVEAATNVSQIVTMVEDGISNASGVAYGIIGLMVGIAVVLLVTGMIRRGKSA